jgi:putative SOS response-associated peptidase YedK
LCGRYYFSDKTEQEIEDELHLPRGSLAVSAGDITPGMTTTGVVWNKGSSGDLALSHLFWGMVSGDRKLIINARAESVTKKPMFAESIMNRRCILPAAGFYEWDLRKTKFRFKRADGKSVYLAGFYDLSENRDCFVILTTNANASMKPVHDRMPVMIDGENVRDYLKDSSAAMEMICEPMPELDRSSDYEQLSLF